MTYSNAITRAHWTSICGESVGGGDAVVAARTAITRMLLNGSSSGIFFATLAMELQIVANEAIGTAATDGTHLVISPTWFMSLDKFEQAGIVAHEVMHLALSHHLRRRGRDVQAWNVACDLAINSILRSAGFKLPDCGVFAEVKPYKHLSAGESAEYYYDQLVVGAAADAGGGGGDDGGGGGSSTSCGEVIDACDSGESTKAVTSAWRAKLTRAQLVAESVSKLPYSLRMLIDQQVNPQVDYRQVLRQFISQAAQDEYCWGRPNRRYVSSGIHLPSRRSDSLGDVVLAVDSSASVFDPTTMSQFSAECASALQAYNCRAKIVHCDDRVRHVEDWDPLQGPFVLRPLGGGGTSHVPVWEWLKMCDATPVCVICLTDGHTTFGVQPDVPVLWVMTTQVEPPFGQVVRIEAA